MQKISISNLIFRSFANKKCLCGLCLWGKIKTITNELYGEKATGLSKHFSTNSVNYLKLDHLSFDLKRMKYREENGLFSKSKETSMALHSSSLCFL